MDCHTTYMVLLDTACACKMRQNIVFSRNVVISPSSTTTRDSGKRHRNAIYLIEIYVTIFSG